MCRRRALLLLAVAVAAARPATGQALARLEREWKEAEAASARVDSLARLRMRALLDTVRAGNLIVLAPSDLAPVATAAAPRAWMRVLAIYGDEAHLTGNRPLVVALYRSDSGPPPYGFPSDALGVPVGPGPPNADRLVAQLGIALPNKLRTLLDSQLNRWVSAAITAASPDSAPAGAFEDLVTEPSPLARSCYVGSLSACGTALGLVPPHDAATEWYDAPGRRELVHQLVRDPVEGVWFDQCLEQAVDAACLHVLRGPDSVHTRAPLMAGSRDLMVRIAVTLGGPHAFHRLLASAGQPLSRRLEIASGVSLDSLLSRWRSTVMAARPASVVLTPGLGWVALGWALALGALVLGSSRWRV
jgi:hypothetical protein